MSVTGILRSGAGVLGLLAAAGCSPAPSPPVAGGPTAPVVSAAKPLAAPTWPAITFPPVQDPAPLAAACVAGDPKACASAAQLYHDGWGIARDVGRIDRYATPACKAGIAQACTLRALVHLTDERGGAPPGIQALKTYLASVVAGPDTRPALCIELPSRDRWGWAAYQQSDCHGAHAAASNTPSPVPEGEERRRTYAACFDAGELEACRGIVMTTNPDEDLYRRFAPICRSKGAACDVALGDSPQETARFRLQACREHSYPACARLVSLAADAGAPLDRLTTERLAIEVCLHPEINFKPLSVGRANPDESGPEEGCEPGAFKALSASTDAGDRALLQELARAPEKRGTP